MRAIVLWSAAAAICLCLTLILGSYGVRAHAAESDEAQIRKLEGRFVAAVQKKDADAIMANYTKNEKMVVFDVIPPRQYTGWDAYKQDWQGVLSTCKGDMKVEMSDLTIDAGSEYGFGHNIQHFHCDSMTPPDMTLRVSDGFRKVNGKWLIAHEHVSVPVDLATSKPDFSSKP